MTKEKILYFDCSSGISGDMTLGALMDLGADQEKFLQELKKLNLDGYKVTFEKVVRNAITMNHADVKLEHDHSHSHEHSHTHEHDHNHNHVHTHAHRSFRDIKKMIEESDLDSEVKKLAIRIFTRVAKAEAKVHNKDVEEVAFHEVGAVDSIVDIVGCAILVSQIKPDRIFASVVSDGHGFIECQHGMLSVPVPAVSEIFAASDVIMKQIDIDTELVTPTGAAIIAELAEGFGSMPRMKIEKIGWGAGTKILPIPNALKIYQGSLEEESTESAYEQDEIAVLEANLDDCTGEMLGYAMEKLFQAGALDVFYTAIYMKKNRPGWRLTVLCRPKDSRHMEDEIFLHTTTIGIRKRKEQRSILKRQKGFLDTQMGAVETKEVMLKDTNRSYIEYESAAALAKEAGCSLWEVYHQYGRTKE